MYSDHALKTCNQDPTKYSCMVGFCILCCQIADKHVVLMEVVFPLITTVVHQNISSSLTFFFPQSS